MAGMGPPPKENRRRQNKDTYGAEKVELTEEQLTELRTIPEGDWLSEVRLWWRTWSTCAQAQLFTQTDWQRLRTLIVTVQSYHLRPTPQKMAEIRQTETLLGATYVDRMRARIKINKPDEQPKAELRAIDDYRKRLAG
jgi:hypothetical protein